LTTRAVFFDLGGTLLVMRRDRIFRRVINDGGRDAPVDAIHSAYMGLEPWWLSTYSGATMSPEQTDDAYRHLDQRVFAELFPDASREEAANTSKLVRSRWQELAKDIPLELFSDVEPTLATLSKQGYSLGLISNATADTRRTVSTLGLDRFLATVVISGVVGYTKPNPEIFRIALKEAGAKAEEGVHVGDVYEADVVGARNAGMKGVLIDRTGLQSPKDCPRITSLEQIFSHL
jgi:HAD superfamily hydrolase (TIGR01549 family)